MNRTFIIVTTIVLIKTALISCQESEHDFERSSCTIDNQHFEILTAHRIIDDFISNKPDYYEAVFDRIEQEFSTGAEFPMLLEMLKHEIEPDNRLKEVNELMKKIDFEQIVRSELRQAVQEIPGPDTKILFLPSNPKFKEMLESYGAGLHAFTLGAGRIIVSVNPTIENWQQLLPYALAHEYHHSVWIARNFERSDLSPLEYILLEGRADAFALELFPDTVHPFLKSLSKEQEQKFWNIIKPEMYDRTSDLNDRIMSGTEDMPPGTVYSIGFSIIESFKELHPEVSDRELIDMSADSILELSQYHKSESVHD